MSVENMASSDLFHAAYDGRADLVRELLAAGADVNGRARQPHDWISAAAEPTPLNCALIAWEYSASLVETVKVLLAAGAVVDRTHFDDFAAESLGCAVSSEIHALIEEQAARQAESPAPKIR